MVVVVVALVLVDVLVVALVVVVVVVDVLVVVLAVLVVEIVALVAVLLAELMGVVAVVAISVVVGKLVVALVVMAVPSVLPVPVDSLIGTVPRVAPMASVLTVSVTMVVLDVMVDTSNGMGESSCCLEPTIITTTATIAPTATSPNDKRHILTDLPHFIDQPGSSSFAPVPPPPPAPSSSLLYSWYWAGAKVDGGAGGG